MAHMESTMVTIIARDMTPNEHDLVNVGFLQNTIDSGVVPQESDRFGTVAIDGDRFVGAASGLAYKNGDRCSGWFHLTDLFVDKGYRRQGIGARLLSRLEDTIQPLGVRKIYTWTAGYEAPAFYAKLGYYAFAELEDYFSSGHSRIALRKDLYR